MPQQNYIDGYPGDAVAISQAPRQYPLRKFGNTTHAVYTRKYQQALASFTPSPIGMKDPLASGFYLTDESVPEIDQGIMAEFTRTFANVPASHYNYSTTTFTRPASLLSFSGAVREVGSETDGNAGLVVRKSSGAESYDIYTRNTISGDSVTAPVPTGGTFTITTQGLGTTAAIAYNATSATQQAAIAAISGSSNFNISVNGGSGVPGFPYKGYDFIARVWPKLPTATPVAGAGMSTTSYYGGTGPTVGYNTAYSSVTVSMTGHALTFRPKYLSGNPNYSSNVDTGVPVYVPRDVSLVYTASGYYIRIVAPYYNDTTDGVIGSSITGGTITLLGSNGTSATVTLPNRTFSIASSSWSVDILTYEAQVRSAIDAAIQTIKAGSSSGNSVSGGGLPCSVGDAEGISLYYDLFAPLIFRRYETTNVVSVAFTNITVAPNAPVGWSLTVGWGASTATVSASTTSASLTSALNSLSFVTGAALKLSATVTQKTNGVTIVIDGLYDRAISFTSSLTPAPSSVDSAVDAQTGLTMYSLRSSTATRTITFSRAHSLIEGDSIYVKTASGYSYGAFAFTVTGPTTISVSSSALGWGTAVTGIGKFLFPYKGGSAVAQQRETIDYFRVAVGTEYSEVGQIPVSTAGFKDEDYIDAIFTPDRTHVICDVDALEEYMPGIWKRIRKEIKIR